MLHLFDMNIIRVMSVDYSGLLSEIFAYCIFTFHTPEKPKQALSQFLSVCQYLTLVDEFFVCTFHGETHLPISMELSLFLLYMYEKATSKCLTHFGKNDACLKTCFDTVLDIISHLYAVVGI